MLAFCHSLKQLAYSINKPPMSTSLADYMEEKGN